jgi:hypothetical protein
MDLRLFDPVGSAGVAAIAGVIGSSATVASQPAGVFGASSDYGVVGSGDDAGVYGLHGNGQNSGSLGNPGSGVRGEAWDGDGVSGWSREANKSGVYGEHTEWDGFGVFGRNTSRSTTGYLTGEFGVRGDGGTSGNAGYFQGNVTVTGDLTVSGSLSKGGGSFRIDHPLDPAHRTLTHSFVESPEMKNVYDGVVVLDSYGEAWVELPEWFQALNRDFRYQLTCVGGHAPVYIADEVASNRFRIAGGFPGLKVSWQITGVRHDRWAEANRFEVEGEKPREQWGRYLHPELWEEGSER